jgi:replication factor C small subunit
METQDSSVWIEKYRPSKFSEIKGQKDVISRIKAFVEQKNLPHLLLSGPAGTGKTTTALVIAKELFGSDWRHSLLELNASDERGIDVVRVKVKDFARSRAIRDDIPFKIIYLDECDALTKEAQHALRRTMENYTQTCRFILSCNYSSKIIDPIQSRCAIFRFRPLDEKDVNSIIDKISADEHLKVTPEARKALVEVADGDCRRVENILQSASAMSKSVSEDDVYSLASVAKPKEIKAALDEALKGDFLKSRKSLLKIMQDFGLSGLDVIRQIQGEIWNLDISGEKKVCLIDKCGEIEFRMVEGADEFIQLEAFLAQLTLAGKK